MPRTDVLNIHNLIAIILILCYLAKTIDEIHGNHLQIEIPWKRLYILTNLSKVRV